MKYSSSWPARLVATGALLCNGMALGDEGRPAATAPECSSAEYRQFDFWIGAWSVTEGGQPAGHNDIVSDLNHCALFESWTAADGSRGRSVNFYDRRRHQWHQTWIDDRGGALALSGGIVGGSMVLDGERPDAKTGAPVRDRITWTPQPDGSVRQHWQTLKAGSTTWETVFDGLYRRLQ